MEDVHFLKNVVLLLATAVLVVAMFKKLKLSPVLGYFVAGGMIGEHGFNIVTSSQTSILGEIGVVFLLFAIGIELTFERLKSMRRHVFGLGSAQFLITAVIVGLFAYYCNKGMSTALIVGGGLALSSTAIVLQVLAENREQSTQVGRLSLAILLMQDFAVVPLLVIIPMLAGEQTGLIKPISEAFGKAALTILIIFVLGRLFLRPIFHAISSSNSAKTNELFIATTLLIALGTAWATHSMGLSLALGAFAAGLLVAETEFHVQAEESIAPFKGLLLGLFFMSVGMTIDLSLIMSQLHTVVLLCLGLIIIKALIITLLCMLFGFSLIVAIHTGLILAQGGEFAFILFRLAQSNGLISNDLSQTLLIVVTITMALTPLLGIIGEFIATKLDKKTKMVVERVYKENADLNNHVIVLGFGRVGKMVANILEAEKINYIAVDIDAEHVSEAKSEGFPIYLGDASNLIMLKSIGTERSSSVIITIENQITLQKATKIINTNFPEVPIVVRAEDLSNAEELKSMGAKIIVPEAYEAGLQLGGAVLRSIGINETEISRVKNRFRAANYGKITDVLPDEFIEENETDDLAIKYVNKSK